MASGPLRTFTRVAVLLLAVYLAIDVSAPLLPGAFRFDVDESIEAGGRLTVRPHLVPAVLVLPSTSALVVRPVAAPAAAARRRSFTARVTDVPRPARTDAVADVSEDA